MTRSQQRVTADPFRNTVYTWTAPTLEQIVNACPGLAQQVDGDRHYLVPCETGHLPITYGALERLYASAAA